MCCALMETPSSQLANRFLFWAHELATVFPTLAVCHGRFLAFSAEAQWPMRFIPDCQAGGWNDRHVRNVQTPVKGVTTPGGPGGRIWPFGRAVREIYVFLARSEWLNFWKYVWPNYPNTHVLHRKLASLLIPQRLKADQLHTLADPPPAGLRQLTSVPTERWGEFECTAHLRSVPGPPSSSEHGKNWI